MSILWAAVLCVAIAAGWVLTVLGMPGNWFILAVAAAYAWLGPVGSPLEIGWASVLVLAALAVAGEIIETAAGMVGVAKVGGSRRGAVLSLVGSIVGSVAGLFVGVPVPVVGSLIAAVVFGGVGAIVGAMIGERWKGYGIERSWQVGRAAFWGRLWGTLGKVLVASVMVAVTLAALVLD
jgi:uncharacterized protein YqgC (DUF456 family)